MKGRVLTIAGSDCSGGAGIQADIKSITALGGYASTAITALTIQSTTHVFKIIKVEPKVIIQQVESVLNDIGTDVIKIGMLYTSPVVLSIVRLFQERYRDIPIILDPVMVAQNGSILLKKNTISSLYNLLCPLAILITPNIPEAEALSGLKISCTKDIIHAAEIIGRKCTTSVLIKGGHSKNKKIVDVLWCFYEKKISLFENDRIPSKNIHGTGCSLSSAIAISLAQGIDMHNSIKRARIFIREAIRTAPNYGKGSGPINHVHTIGA